MATNEIFQYSLLAALMDGVAAKGIPISDLVAEGDHGLGTFKCMAGEMIIFDGKVYQMKSDGTVVPYDTPEALAKISPFALVTRFKATTSKKARITSKQGLSEIIDDLLPRTRNHFVSIRIDGTFKSVTVRTAAGQKVPGEKLMEVGRNQVEHTFESMRGTIVGFRSPDYAMGIGVAGVHIHFINEECTHGGHILELEADQDVEIGVAQITTVHMHLPADDEEYDAATLTGHAEGIAVVEG